MKLSIRALLQRLCPTWYRYCQQKRDSWRRRIREVRSQRRNRKRSVEEVFTGIYEENKWGGEPGDFSSGLGSTVSQIVLPYVNMVSEKAASEPFVGKTFVDLGCGDFRVGRQLLSLCSKYVGVDIVRPLVEKNQREYGSSSVSFVHLDIIEDDLPHGDVCFLRQVLQHLSNQQIACVLQKLDRYRWVFITEHYPDDNVAIRPNLDKVHGEDIRAYRNSGVYLSCPPFNLPEERLEVVLEVPGTELESGISPGIIRTFLYRPEA
jgi:SAM-dependent methyltransferase